MRLLTFNLWHGLTPTSPLVFEALEPEERRRLRLKKQVEVIHHANADVCFFQECNPIARRAGELGRALGLDVTLQPDLVGLKLLGLGLPLNLNSGLAILAKPQFELNKREGFSLTRPGPNLVNTWMSWQLKEERFALFSEIFVPSLGKVLLVDTHLHHGLEVTEDFHATIGRLGAELNLPTDTLSELRARLAMGNERRETEIKRLIQKIESFGSKYDAVILGGDFNASPGGALGKRLRDAGFLDLWLEARPNDPGYSFDQTRNEANHILQSQFPLTVMVEDLSFTEKIKDALLRAARAQEYRPRRIDFLWAKARSPLHVRSAELIGLPDSEGLAPSDHFGVLVELQTG